MTDMTGWRSTICVVLACAIGGLVAYLAELPAWSGGALALAAYAGMVLVNTVWERSRR